MWSRCSTADGLTAVACSRGRDGRPLVHTPQTSLWHVTELPGEDKRLLGVGGAARRLAPGERAGDVAAAGALAFGAVTGGAKGGLAGIGERGEF